MVTMTPPPPNQQCPFWSHEMLNRYGKIFGSGTQKCIQSDHSILGLSVQGLVSHIINEVVRYLKALPKGVSTSRWFVGLSITAHIWLYKVFNNSEIITTKQIVVQILKETQETRTTSV